MRNTAASLALLSIVLLTASGADKMTDSRALAAIKQCIANNGSPRVLGVQDTANGAIADVQFTNFETHDRAVGNLTMSC